ncbi:TorF family putative porin [Janthinobacterium sp.]|uniref:TorF family putative porin n=1 Tax=Janthinobacterium sp. TaxID=1871054 RepID=UPI00293D504B|nr:TorF family putative porin [Janthinobacterium sp.]
MKNLTTNLTLAAALTLALAAFGGMAHAEDAKPEAKPDNEVSYNVALTNDYRFRGVSQSRLDPALQGGVDYTHNPTGLYAGTWLSTIKWTKDAGGSGDVEMDIYGGKKGEIAKDISYDVGGLYYFYPSNGLHPSANTFELYGQVGFGPFYVKYSHATTNLFANDNSKNSGYLDAGFNYDVYQGYTLNLHAGHQNVKNHGDLSYSDYKIGVTKDFGIVTVALAAIKADIELPAPNGKNTAKTGLILTVSKTF